MRFFYIINHLNSHIESNVHIILGDFNMDALKDNKCLQDLLKEYTMVVAELTHLLGSLLDHVYIRSDYLLRARSC